MERCVYNTIDCVCVRILTPHCSATRGLWVTDHVILNHGQVTWTRPELGLPLLTTTPHQREDVSALDRFNVHRCPTRRVGTGLELVTRQATIRYLYHSATAADLLNPKNYVCGNTLKIDWHCITRESVNNVKVMFTSYVNKWPRKRSVHNYGLLTSVMESCVRVLMRLKARCLEVLIHVKSVVLQRWAWLVWRVGCKFMYRPRHLIGAQNYELLFLTQNIKICNVALGSINSNHIKLNKIDRKPVAPKP
ncbi:uncharacterized protein TNCV_1624681 [Trichonephila clavipes]|nr:uncharacterized protein TNCV_1624681 [Trichonephila clavipes]